MSSFVTRMSASTWNGQRASSLGPCRSSPSFRFGDPIKVLDASIIGAGPAGLTAATYLRRFHRDIVVIDGHASRARWIPKSHNIPGFPLGIAGTELLEQLRAQAARYGANILDGRVTSLAREGEHFTLRTSSDTIRTRYVLLATGILDRFPALPGAEEAVLRSLLRICPVCDGFESSGKNIGVISDGEHGQREAEFLLTYSDRITLIHIGDKLHPAAAHRLHQRGIRTLETKADRLRIETGELRVLEDHAAPVKFDVCYSALGCMPQNRLATGVGAALDDTGALVVDAHQETSVPGLYAAGDVVRGLNQVVVAAAEAAIAATDIHNKLRQDPT